MINVLSVLVPLIISFAIIWRKVNALNSIVFFLIFFLGILFFFAAMQIEIFTISIFPLGFFESISTLNGWWKNAIFSFGIVAIAEEGLRWGIVKFCLHKKFSSRYNLYYLIIFLTMGFVSAENYHYIQNSEHPSALLIFRLLTALPAHLLFALLMAYLFTNKKTSTIKIGNHFNLSALLVPILFHGLYDFMLFADWISMHWTIILLLVLILFLFITLNKPIFFRINVSAKFFRFN